MRTGFTYRNKHSSEFGSMVTRSRPILPEKKSNIFELPLADGSIDYAAANEYGRAFYKDRVFTVGICIYAKNIRELEWKLSKTALWLSGSGDLIFDDMPAVYWEASVIDQIDYAPERSGTKALISVSFRCKPFSKGFITYGEPITLGTRVPLGSPIPLGGTADNATNREVAANTNTYIWVTNYGTAYTRPKVTVRLTKAAAVSWELALHDRTTSAEKVLKYYYYDTNKYTALSVDMEKYTCIADGAKNYLTGLSGEFFELPQGESLLRFKADGACTVSISYTPAFLWDADYGGGTEYNHA